MSKLDNHKTEIVNRQTGECSEGCHKRFTDFLVCSCGFERAIPQVAEYRHNCLQPMAELVRLSHFVEILAENV